MYKVIDTLFIPFKRPPDHIATSKQFWPLVNDEITLLVQNGYLGFLHNHVIQITDQEIKIKSIPHHIVHILEKL